MTRRLFVLAVPLALLGGCCYQSVPSSSGSSGGSTGGASGQAAASSGSTSGGGTTGGSSGGVATSGGGSTSGGVTSGGSPDAGPLLGLVDFEKVVTQLGQFGGGTQTAFTASAYFGSALPPSSEALLASCAGGIRSGACCYLPNATGLDAGFPTGSSANAGDIALTGAGGAPLGTLVYGSGSQSYPLLSSCGYTGAPSSCDAALGWDGGASLTASAAGAAVGPFSASIDATADFAGLSPSFSSQVAVPLSGDFTVSWLPAAGSATPTVTLLLTAQSCSFPSTSDGLVFCETADSSGTVTVPGALLAHFHDKDVGGAILVRRGELKSQLPDAQLTVGSGATTAGVASYGSACVP